MLRFNVHQFFLHRTHYVLLPKLNESQMQVIAQGFQRFGHLARTPEMISLQSKAGTVHVIPSGLCWSRIDPSDLILPLVPDILSASKSKIQLGELESKYFRVKGGGGTGQIHLSVRLESGALWSALRASGGCALAPDEREVIALLLGRSLVTCRMISDHPYLGSKIVVIGRRRYFDTASEISRSAETLQCAGTKAGGNSYVPIDGVMRLNGDLGVLHRSCKELFDSLGEWCYFSSE